MTTVHRSKMPGWAWDLIARVEREEHMQPVEIRWRDHSASSFYSTGEALNGRTNRYIAVRAGGEMQDARLTILHELAHIKVGCRNGHNMVWVATAVQFYLTYGDEALIDWAASEEPYARVRKAAKKVARRS